MRVAIGSNKRFCPDCGEKWHLTRDIVGTSSRRVSELEITILASVTAILLISVVNFFQDQSFDVKTMVVSYYDDKYGVEAKGRLWSDWGWLYGSRDEAKKAYQGGGKN